MVRLGGVATFAALAVLASTAHAADEPDLVLRLPAEPYETQVAPVYVDRFALSGRLMYRFDAIFLNQGGTLDVFRDRDNGRVMQAIWPGGRPTTPPDPNQPPPSGGDVTVEDRSHTGASFSYVYEADHDHWHFSTLARYELLLPGGGRRVSDKVGFCFLDSFDTGARPLYFPPDHYGSGSQTWCGFDHPQGDFVRMGLSPGLADRYQSQQNFQWVDVTGLAPGYYTLRATANPRGYIRESDTTNNVVDLTRAVPGVLAAGRETTTRPGRPVQVSLSGSLVAPEIPARRSAACEPTADSHACYAFAAEDGPLAYRIARQPTNGSATIDSQSGLSGSATYTPDDGFEGTDSFAYTATDARGLTSRRATVTVTVDSP